MIDQIIIAVVVIAIYWDTEFSYESPKFSINKSGKQLKTIIKFGD